MPAGMMVGARSSHQELVRKAAAVLPWLLWIVTLCTISAGIFLPALGTFRDDGIYLSSARALAQGKGYVIDMLPGSPPNTKYPPVTSLLLAIPYLAGFDPLENPAAFKVIPFGFLIAWFIALAVICNEAGIGKDGKGWVLCCTASQSMVAYCSTMPLSDVISAALLAWALVYIIRSLKNSRGSIAEIVKAGVLLGLSVLTRTSTLAALVGVVGGLMYLRRFRDALVIVVVTLVFVFPWLAWVYVQAPVSETVLAFYTSQPYSDWWVWRVGSLHDAVTVVLANCFFTVVEPMTVIALVAPLAGLLLGLGLFTLAFASECFPNVRIILIFVVVALFMMGISWLWPPGRIVLPIYPLLFVLIAGGHYSQGLARSLAIVACMMCLLNGWGLLKSLREGFRTGTPALFGKPGDDWRTIQQMGKWISRNTTAGETIGSLQDGAFSIVTGRTVVFPAVIRSRSLFYGGSAPPIGTGEEFKAALHRLKIRYLALTPSRHFAEALPLREVVGRLLNGRPSCLRVAADYGGGYEIYEFLCGTENP